jgi:hypothetical protein
MKTIEERAKKLRRQFYSPSGDESELQMIKRYMRELVEDCMKVANDQHKDCSVGCCVSRRVADGIACRISRMLEPETQNKSE